MSAGRSGFSRGDLVLHRADRKSADWLMIVVSGCRRGLVVTRYLFGAASVQRADFYNAPAGLVHREDAGVSFDTGPTARGAGGGR